MTQPTTQISTQTPAKPTVRQYLSSDKFRDEVEKALPKHITPDRFVRVALTALTKTPKLAECTQASLFNALLTCSQLGLEPDGRRAHLIPYKDQCQLIIDYKGLIELAKRSGEVESWSAEIVKEHDEFSWDNGIVTHKIDWRKPRGESQCVYSRVRLQGGSFDYAVMTMEEVDAIRRRSRAGQNGPWVTDFDEMAKKTVIRRHSKYLTLSPEFRQALDADDDAIDITSSKPERTTFASMVDSLPEASAPSSSEVASPAVPRAEREELLSKIENYCLDKNISDKEVANKIITVVDNPDGLVWQELPAVELQKVVTYLGL